MKFKRYGIDRPSTKKSCCCVVLRKDHLGGLKPDISIWLPSNHYTDGYFIMPKCGGDAHSNYQTDISEDVVYFCELDNIIDDLDTNVAFKD